MSDPSSPSVPSSAPAPKAKRRWPPWVVFALKVIYACACGVFIGYLWTFFTSERSPFAKANEQRNLVLEQQNQPGAAELRADGCQAVMMSTPAFRATHYPRAKKTTETYLTCVPFLLKTPPTCERLARHYVALESPPGPITVTVTSPSKSSRCTERFDAKAIPILADAGR